MSRILRQPKHTLSKSTKSKILLILVIDCSTFKKWNRRERKVAVWCFYAEKCSERSWVRISGGPKKYTRWRLMPFVFMPLEHHTDWHTWSKNQNPKPFLNRQQLSYLIPSFGWQNLSQHRKLSFHYLITQKSMSQILRFSYVESM
jgi:hypothetical protein